MIFSSLVLILLQVISQISCETRPNVVIIMVDDLGWNDVGFHGHNSEILTPNIDALAYSGVILNRFYTAPLCTPSRTSFMTGKYPTRVGMSHYVIYRCDCCAKIFVSGINKCSFFFTVTFSDEPVSLINL